MRFLPQTDDSVRAMLEVVGVERVEDLFRDVPAELRATAAVDLAPGLPESDLLLQLSALADRNVGAHTLSFLGAGAYPHFVPAAVDNLLQRAEFYSAYTPYQPEVSQGTLQAIFEFQSMVAMLLGLDVANASMYDGASAAAEAALMALRVQPKRARLVVARSLHPQYRQVLATYLQGVRDTEVVEVGFGDDGRIDPAALRQMADERTAAVIAGTPNFFGVIEDVAALSAVARGCGALLVTATAEAMSLAAVRSPGELGADIAVAEGQSLGVPMSYGGPGVGLFAARDRYVRSLPGRLVGEAHDAGGRRGYVLTLATREQHIRRERATSNICTNQGLIALAVTIYLSLAGKHGLAKLGALNLQRAHRAQAAVVAGGGWRPRFSGPFFNEFTLRGKDAAAALRRARDAGVVAGVALGEWYPELDDSIVLAVTETHTDADVGRLAEVLTK
jgi:glycine dehydrogenase subunit 1